jgi:anthranilate synthase component 1
MRPGPDLEVLTGLYEAGTPSLLHTVLVGDLETPVAAFLKLRADRKGAAFLLESVEAAPCGAATP